MGGLIRSLRLAAVLAVIAGPVWAQSVFSRMPESMGGLPADAPAAPKTPYAYPAVHDMPPDRKDKTLTDDQQSDLLNELENARDRQMRRAGEDPDAADKPVKKPAVTKKKVSEGKKPPRAAAQAGVKPNP